MKCQFVLVSGPNKGSRCSQNAMVTDAYQGKYCSRHAKAIAKRQDNTVKTTGTVQLKNENKSLALVRTDMEQKHGYTVVRRVESTENRMKSTTADFITKKDGQEYTLSVKNNGGEMSQGNFGTGVAAQFTQLLKKNGCLQEVDMIRDAVKEVAQRKTLLAEKHLRWKEFGDDAHQKKLWVCSPLLDCYRELFSRLQVVQLWVDYIRGRQSDILAVVVRGEINYHYKRATRSGGALVVKEFQLETNGDDQIGAKVMRLIINRDVRISMRLKSEGGKVKSSIKLNMEHQGHFI